MKNSSKILLAMGVGALAGGLAGYYLNSDKGRRVRKNAVKNIKATAKEAREKITEMADTAKTAISDFAGQAKNYMGNITRSADEAFDKVKENFEKGKDTAKAKAKLVEKAMASNDVES